MMQFEPRSVRLGAAVGRTRCCLTCKHAYESSLRRALGGLRGASLPLRIPCSRLYCAIPTSTTLLKQGLAAIAHVPEKLDRGRPRELDFDKLLRESDSN